jgi:hypothetical protein
MERGKVVHEFVWRPEVNRLLGRHRRRCEDVNKVDLQDKSAWTGLIWLEVLTHDLHFCVWKCPFAFQKRPGNVSTRYIIIRF